MCVYIYILYGHIWCMHMIAFLNSKLLRVLFPENPAGFFNPIGFVDPSRVHQKLKDQIGGIICQVDMTWHFLISWVSFQSLVSEMQDISRAAESEKKQRIFFPKFSALKKVATKLKAHLYFGVFSHHHWSELVVFSMKCFIRAPFARKKNVAYNTKGVTQPSGKWHLPKFWNTQH